MVYDLKICAFIFLMGVLVCTAASISGSQNPADASSCMRNCPVTADYRPFCGTDGNSYPTTSILSCFQRCGIAIYKAYDGDCKQPTSSTSQAPANPTPPNPILEDQCVKNCPTTYDYRPLCGSDGHDYANPSFITCFQNCGKPIQKAHDGYCNGQQQFTIPISQTPANPSTPNPIFKDQCVKNCPTTFDYRPLCGSDGQDYANPSFITCFQNCGKQITKAHDGKCNSKN